MPTPRPDARPTAKPSTLDRDRTNPAAQFAEYAQVASPLHEEGPSYARPPCKLVGSATVLGAIFPSMSSESSAFLQQSKSSKVCTRKESVTPVKPSRTFCGAANFRQVARGVIFLPSFQSIPCRADCRLSPARVRTAGKSSITRANEIESHQNAVQESSVQWRAQT